MIRSTTDDEVQAIWYKQQYETIEAYLSRDSTRDQIFGWLMGWMLGNHFAENFSMMSAAHLSRNMLDSMILSLHKEYLRVQRGEAAEGGPADGSAGGSAGDQSRRGVGEEAGDQVGSPGRVAVGEQAEVDVERADAAGGSN